MPFDKSDKHKQATNKNTKNRRRVQDVQVLSSLSYMYEAKLSSNILGVCVSV